MIKKYVPVGIILLQGQSPINRIYFRGKSNHLSTKIYWVHQFCVSVCPLIIRTSRPSRHIFNDKQTNKQTNKQPLFSRSENVELKITKHPSPLIHNKKQLSTKFLCCHHVFMLSSCFYVVIRWIFQVFFIKKNTFLAIPFRSLSEEEVNFNLF